jgi:hypothetical protein
MHAQVLRDPTFLANAQGCGFDVLQRYVVSELFELCQAESMYLILYPVLWKRGFV